jgi:D-glycero-D-manno-heptose 1,7-bisphosphate phosphatase
VPAQCEVQGARVMSIAVPVLYLDLDGTVRKGYDELGRWVNGPDDVEVFPEAVRRMTAWKEGGGRIVGVSNQGGIALGHVSADQVRAAMLRTHQLCNELFDKIAWCSHHPGAHHPEWSRCWCRKPRAGLLIEAGLALSERYSNEMYPPYMALMVGDRPEDQGAAEAANVDFQWAVEWRST